MKQKEMDEIIEVIRKECNNPVRNVVRLGWFGERENIDTDSLILNIKENLKKFVSENAPKEKQE